MRHGQRQLTVPAPVALHALAGVAGGGVRHAGAVAARSARAERVDARLARGAFFRHVTRRAPTVDCGKERKQTKKREGKTVRGTKTQYSRDRDGRDRA